MEFGHVALIMVGAAVLQAVGANTFTGQGTYYGDNGWAGSCMGNVRWAGGVYNAASWPPNGIQSGTRVALNSAQYSTAMCGKKLMFRGTGQGLGHSPVSTSWQEAIVTNLCPECQYGDLDMGMGGDGRWGIEWYWLGDASSGLTTEANTVARAITKTAPRKIATSRKQLVRRKPQSSKQPKPKSSHWTRAHHGKK